MSAAISASTSSPVSPSPWTSVMSGCCTWDPSSRCQSSVAIRLFWMTSPPGAPRCRSDEAPDPTSPRGRNAGVIRCSAMVSTVTIRPLLGIRSDEVKCTFVSSFSLMLAKRTMRTNCAPARRAGRSVARPWARCSTTSGGCATKPAKLRASTSTTSRRQRECPGARSAGSRPAASRPLGLWRRSSTPTPRSATSTRSICGRMHYALGGPSATGDRLAHVPINQRRRSR